jgi:hypothetical protein
MNFRSAFLPVLVLLGSATFVSAGPKSIPRVADLSIAGIKLDDAKSSRAVFGREISSSTVDRHSVRHLWMIAPARAGEAISHRSPDKQFGIRIVEPADAPPRVELVALPSRDRVLELDPSLAGRGAALSWSPDSQRFVVGAEEEEHDPPGTFRAIEVYERAGESFKKVELPDLRFPEADWPKGTSRKTGIEDIAAVRWSDARTLVLERTTSSPYGPNLEKLWRVTSEITIRFDKEGKATVASVKKGKEERR